MKPCTYCGKPTNNPKFCSLKCANSFNNRLRTTTFLSKTCIRDGCNNQFAVALKDKVKKYCSQSCAAKVSNSGRNRHNGGSAKPPVFCVTCGKKLVRNGTNPRYPFHNRIECRRPYEINLWLVGTLSGNNKYYPKKFVYEWLLQRSGGQCEGIDSRTGIRCTETRILQLDHIDGNWQNTTPHNVRHLCPTCHVLTDTYGIKNLGKGRTWKRDYNQYEPKHTPNF